MKPAAAPLLLAAILAAAGPQAAYEVTRWQGDHGFLFDFRGASRAVLGPGQDDVLSGWQPLPFPWTFFGAKVEGYYISDNGYITFDRDAKASVPVNTVLPHAAAPRHSIFAFWTDIRLDAARGQWDNRVWTATLGQAPDRVHVIYWLAVVPAPDSFDRANWNFALALYENGSFEVIFTSGRRGTPVRATIGAVGPDGRASVAAGADLDFPNVGFGGEDDVNYLFKPAGR